jgi:predicted Zn-dependent protease
MRRVATTLLILGTLSSCFAEKPARLSTTTTTTAAEQKLRGSADEMEKSLRESELAVHDDKLHAYLGSIAERLLVAQGASGQKVRILVGRDALLNALAMPNGFIYLHSGLLAGLENEAQLSIVIGHEIEHYLGRHPLRQIFAYEHEVTKRNTVMAVTVFLAVLGGGNASLATVPYVTSRIAIDGYQRDIERDADAAGMNAMAAAGYDVREAPRMFELLAEAETEARVVEPYYYGSHPALTERIRTSKLQIEKLTASGWSPEGKRDGKAEYEAAIAELLLSNAELDEKLRRFNRARRAIDRYIRIRPDSSKGYFARGELERREAGSRKKGLEVAVASYRRAAELDPRNADAERELGLALRDLGREAEARGHLARYLQLAPAAKDRLIVESYLR